MFRVYVSYTGSNEIMEVNSNIIQIKDVEVSIVNMLKKM